MITGNAKNRGYYKIKGAARAFNFDFRGKTVLDIGSSTGGFTEYALERGAKKVIAIEKGTNQMLPYLRTDPRVDLHEKTDIFDVGISKTSFEGNPQLLRGLEREPREDGREERPEKEVLLIPAKNTIKVRPEKDISARIPTPDIILADVSFVSLKKILLYAKKNLSDSRTEFLVMLKPQFEATSRELNNGVVKNEKIRREIIKNFEFWLKRNHFLIIKKRDNELKGKTGNRERFYYLKLEK